jgi:predicted RNase H-like HicB family nuclease
MPGFCHLPKLQRLTAIFYKESEVYVAECPEVGTASQGDSIEEALANLREATELDLEECPQPALAPRLQAGVNVETLIDVL